MTAPTRPLLRYHGGKWMLAPWIIANFPPHRVYVEPFGGAASVLLRKPRARAEVYNDSDDDVVNLFRVVRDSPADLMRALRRTPYARAEYEAAFDPCSDPVERARRLVVRSVLGFGTNNLRERKGFRDYTGKLRSGLPVDDFRTYPRAVAAFVRRLRGVVVERAAAAHVIQRHDGADTLFYCDPPYVHDTRAVIAESHVGYAHEMTDADHEALAAQLGAVNGMVVLSGYHGALYDRLFGDWQRLEKAALADGAAPRTEVLWFNAAAWARRHREPSLFDGSAA